VKRLASEPERSSHGMLPLPRPFGLSAGGTPLSAPASRSPAASSCDARLNAPALMSSASWRGSARRPCGRPSCPPTSTGARPRLTTRRKQYRIETCPLRARAGVDSLLPALVVFDIAGTTVRDRGEVAQAFRAVLAVHGLALSAGALEGVRGASKREALHELLPEGPGRAERAARLYAEFRRELEERYRSGGVVAVAGATQVFAWLRSRGVRVALNTGFDRDTTALLLDALGWGPGTVDAVVCGDEVTPGRPAPDLILAAMERAHVPRAERVASVGDTERDLLAGHAAGVHWNIGVLSGAHDRARLARLPHTHLLASVAQLPAVFAASA